ncbi:MAG: ATP-dependent DNA helicase, partial [Lachnospiraceae bacterium]|nr:ATP-dependent DNA helicase [Lachnospiraceae bacterium]
MRDFQISVRELVEFILREGDIDNRGRGSVEQAMLLGARIHRRIQKRQGPDYRAEVPLSLTLDMGEYRLTVSGRADGIIQNGVQETGDGQMTLTEYLDAERDAADREAWEKTPVVDEIKGTYADIDRFEEAKPLHLAQAKCYAWMVLKEQDLKRIRVRITYCQMETEQIRYFYHRYHAEELAAFFDDLITRYRRFSDHMAAHRDRMLTSIREAVFPFPYRKGQKQLVGY